MKFTTYVIGLERNYRGDELEEQLRTLALPFERSPGVEGQFHGQPVANYTEPETATALFGRPLTIGEIGCALAHRYCYEKLLTTDSEWALVFEDDARVVRPSALIEVLQRLTFTAKPVAVLLYGRHAVGVPGRLSSLHETTLHEVIITPKTATGYLINRAAAKLLLETNSLLRNPADWPISAEGKIRFVCAFPWPVRPEEQDQASSIGVRELGRSRAKVLWNRALSLTGAKWILHHRKYRSFGEYYRWEVRRRLVQLAATRGVPYRLPDEVTRIPSASSFAVLLNQLLGGHRSDTLVHEIVRRADHRQ